MSDQYPNPTRLPSAWAFLANRACSASVKRIQRPFRPQRSISFHLQVLNEDQLPAIDPAGKEHQEVRQSGGGSIHAQSQLPTATEFPATTYARRLGCCLEATDLVVDQEFGLEAQAVPWMLERLQHAIYGNGRFDPQVVVVVHVFEVVGVGDRGVEVHH